MTNPPAPVDDETAEPARLWRTVSRVVVTAIALGIALLWIYALFANQPVPGRLDDRAFPLAAEPICKVAHDRIEALPKAQDTKTPAARADVVDQGTTILDGLLGDLRGRLPTTDPARGMVNEWLNDWSTYVHDRRDYTTRLRADSNARFYVTQSDRDGVQITNAVDRFAKVNDMPSCATPDDV